MIDYTSDCVCNPSEMLLQGEEWNKLDDESKRQAVAMKQSVNQQTELNRLNCAIRDFKFRLFKY